MTNTYNKEKKAGTPLSIKLFWYLVPFFLFVIVILWICQTVFMDDFYRVITVYQMKNNSDAIASVVLSDGDVGEASYGAASQSGACVSVYKIEKDLGKKGSPIAEAHVKNGCVIHDMVSNDILSGVYNETRASGGRYATESFGGGEGSVGSILYSRIIKDGNTEYMILFNAESFPVGATAATITTQLAIITFVLIIGAGVLAVVISRKITRPVSELSREAGELAVGDYEVRFTKSGIAEVDSLGETLDYAARELKHSAEMKQELIANITHDLRTPLTMISGYSEVMRDIPGEITPENLQVIIDESARLSALVNDVLEVSRAQNGNVMLNPSVFGITDETRKIVYRYSEMMSAKDYTIEYESDGTDVNTYGDETKLMQAFCNLLNNAINFTGDSKRVVVRQYVRGDVLCTEVTDFGEGIPADELESIWDRYYRARDRHNKGVPGSGLGLSIVKNILLLHDVSFGVVSTPGEGSTFWFEVRIV